ncbi:MAG: cell envelope integrity protein CreD [Muribaculaceae bacterium]|nr:cell envelope integrity protein CreD [Muribaculaceae bacterium]
MVPPPVPPPFISEKPKKGGMTTGSKICLLGLQCALLMIGALAIWLLSYSRDERSNNVAEEITREWGSDVLIDGPVIERELNRDDSCMPLRFVCDAAVSTQSLHRNIYEAEVFTAKIRMSGVFSKDSVKALGDKVVLKVNAPVSKLTSVPKVRIGEREETWQSTDNSLYIEVETDGIEADLPFETELDVQGSGSLFISQVGDESVITISGDARNPSFNGSQLPSERTINDNYFKAEWKSITHFDMNTSDNRVIPDSVGTKFLVGVDRYQKVSRSLKYAFLIIVLTYVCVFFTEIIRRRQIPLLNYFLIGFALILFYSLLLAFSEHLSFGVSYLISSVMTVVLITGYMWKMLESPMVGMTIGVILAALYVSCYVMLIATTYALLLGSLLLFVVLGAMMFASLKVADFSGGRAASRK